VEVDDSLLGEEGQATSMELPNIAASLGGIKQPPAPMVAQHRDEVSDPGTQTAGQRTLVLLADGRELDRVVKERFLIGRGKHCDLIINSGKVSREHAAITREGSVWFIEDLGSSNGTWFDKRRISRRQIQEGDEYFICSEKLSCTFR
jgi:pSer/pThr/pTyr-binding forkhead associated (FHA) protein